MDDIAKDPEELIKEKIERFKNEIEQIIIKYNGEIHAGILLNNALNLIIEMIANTAITREKGFNLIKDLIDGQKNSI